MIEQIPPLPKPAQNKEKEVAYDYDKLAKMQEIFLEQARKNPDIKLVDLDEAVRGIGGEGEKKILEKAILDYKDVRHKMLELQEDIKLEKAGQDKRGEIYRGEELYQHITNSKPNGEVFIQFLPFAVYMRCEQSSDFMFLFSVLGMGGYNDLAKRHELMDKYKKGAAGLQTHFEYAYPDKDVPLIVENRDVYGDIKNDKMQKNRDLMISHEQQHVINNFFTDALFFDKSFVNDTLVKAALKLAETNNTTLIHEGIMIYAEGLTKQYLLNAQNEITAYLGEGVSPDQIAKNLLLKNGLYDYFGENKHILFSRFYDLFGNSANELAEFTENEFYKVYNREIIKAAALCEILLTKYSAEEIVPYLNVAPIWKWEEVKQKLMGDRL